MRFLSSFAAALVFAVCLPLAVFAQETETSAAATGPGTLVIVIAFLIAAPFALLMLTSYVKLAVVLSILRNAVGGGEIPPRHVVIGISLILTIFIMAPVVEKMYQDGGGFDETGSVFSEASVREIFQTAADSREPLRAFLERNTGDQTAEMFLSLSNRLAERNKVDNSKTTKKDFRVLIPAFLVSQLTAAFQIGFLLFLPFLIIDFVVGGILEGVGFSSISHSVVTLPFKLLLFVMIDGWNLLAQNLVLGFL